MTKEQVLRLATGDYSVDRELQAHIDAITGKVGTVFGTLSDREKAIIANTIAQIEF